jgi:apolipoprotein N-acyltransferase
MRKVKKLLWKFIEAIWFGWVMLSTFFIFLDWWVSTEMEFMSTTGEKIFALIWLISSGLFFYVQYLKEEKSRQSRGDTQRQSHKKIKA